MALSRIVHIGDGTTKQFAIPFALGYISQDDISCRVGDEVDGLGEPVYRDLTFLSEELVEISGAAPAVDIRVLFDRTTPKETLIVDFENDAVLNEENLNTAQRQALMVAHEALDGRIAQLQADIDANGYQILNLRTPVDPNEAATKAYVDSTLPGSVQLAQEAAQQAVNAAGASVAAAGQAAGFASAAGSAATTAQQAVTDAQEQVTLAAAQVALAVQAVADATEQVTLANAARADAETARDRARDWAEKMDGPVVGSTEGENQSARWWANKAENEVQQAIEDALAELPPFTGTNGTTPGAQGLVPQPLAADLLKFLSADGTWKLLPNSGVQTVATKAALAALVAPTAGQTALINNAAYGGLFVFDATSRTADVTNDPSQGFYIAPAAAPTGASGVWVRLDRRFIDIRYFGAVSLTTSTASAGTDSTPAIQAAINFARYLRRHVVTVPDGIFRVNGQLELLKGVALHGPGPTIGVRWDGVTGDWDYQGGAVLAITRTETSDLEANSTILMGTGTGVQGLGFWWPAQPMQGGTVVARAFAIGIKPNPVEAEGTLEGMYFRDLHVTNAYNFMSLLNPQGPCDITHIRGFSILMGFRLDNAFDILRMQDVHWNPIMCYVGYWPSQNLKDKTMTAQGIFLQLFKADQAYFKFVFCWGPYYGLFIANSAMTGGGERSANGTRFVSCGFEYGHAPLTIIGDPQGTMFYSLILGSGDYTGTGTTGRGTRAVTVTPPNRIRNLEFHNLVIFDTLDDFATINKVDHLRIDNGLMEGARRIFPGVGETALRITNCTDFSIKGTTIRRASSMVGIEVANSRGGIIWGNFFEGVQTQRVMAINDSKAVRYGWNFNMSAPGDGNTNNVFLGGTSTSPGADVAGENIIAAQA